MGLLSVEGHSLVPLEARVRVDVRTFLGETFGRRVEYGGTFGTCRPPALCTPSSRREPWVDAAVRPGLAHGDFRLDNVQIDHADQSAPSSTGR
ncbi:hypothetical protein [Streptomyces sp. NPDC017993]|uniref:hypothetical protein n=1 Tax=Streptomyces sp. NPDC017993 TaxID=3365027 RepID=UPI0037B26C8D